MARGQETGGHLISNYCCIAAVARLGTGGEKFFEGFNEELFFFFSPQ